MMNFEEFKRDLYYQRALGYITWRDVADKINKEFNLHNSPDSFKKDYYRYYRDDIEQLIQDEVEDQEDNEFIQDDLQELKEELRTIQLEKLKLSDERTQNNAYLRRISREETIKEIALEYAQLMNKEKIFTVPTTKNLTNSSLEAILVLSDWHYGMEVDSYFNTYNVDICKQRVNKLLNETMERCERLGVTKINVVNLSDLIAGRIHYTIRLQSRIDVITQVMEVSEIVAEFLYHLGSKFNVDYYDCMDNHSRVEPNKAMSLDLESLTRITKWYLKERFGFNPVIRIMDNDVSEDIIRFNVFGHKVIAAHGHKDKSNKVIDNLSLFTHEHYDLVLSAHEHHFSADEKNNTIRFSSGTLMGSDDFSENLRLTSTPSQLLIFASKENITEYVCRIIV